MKLSEMIKEENIILELKAKDKKGVLEELAGVIARQEPSVDKEALVRVLLEREQLGTTGIGDGVAIPHGKLNGIEHPVISFGRSRKGLDFESMDGQPTFIFFLLVAPDNSSGVHLQVLAKIAKMLKSRPFRDKLMEADSTEAIYQTIVHANEES
ncbi:MAG: PTS sugar transporter subunit IIA [Deltaproteobacteria bacterium]|nr:MAG: PTS sugar transporter subunit IIA [Deltaproteobacteria bacterium]